MADKRDIDIPRAFLAGMAAGTAYLASMWADNMLSRHKFNDIKLVGQIFTTRSPIWQVQGLLGHYGFSSMMALVYASYAYNRLPGPGWFRGFLFLQIENSSLYLLAPLMDPRHAGVKSGQVPRVWKWKTFWGQVVRHIAFGLTLGALYREGVRVKKRDYQSLIPNP